MVDYRPFGRTGVRISSLTLGAMNFGERGNPDHEDGIRIIHRALDEGINAIDTADVYSQGESEQIVGKALAGGRRDDVFLATKFHGQIGDNPHHRGNSRRWIFQAVENSLRRLNTEAKVTLSPEVLDRIDAIVPPGTTLNPADSGYQPPSLADPARRRRGGTQ